jgi:hypothetical protein
MLHLSLQQAQERQCNCFTCEKSVMKNLAYSLLRTIIASEAIIEEMVDAHPVQAKCIAYGR